MSSCFHCDEPIPRGVDLRVEIDGAPRRMCCAGCKVAAELIRDLGLENYYRFREAGGAPTPPEPGDAGRFEVYDRPQMLACVSQTCGGSPLRESDILLEGIRCAACTWLIESSLSRVEGVEEAQVALATGRMRLVWDPAKVRLSELLARVAALGYRPLPVQGNVVLEAQARERRNHLKRVFVAAIGMMQVMTFAAAVYLGLPRGMEEVYHQFFRYVSMLVATPVVLYAAAPFFQRSWYDLRRGAISMDVPVSIAIGLGYLASLWYTFLGEGEVYYDSITMFTFFLLVGRYLEMLARHRTGDAADALARLSPQTARRLSADGVLEEVGVAELSVGERVRVLPGEAFPADGVLFSGQTRVDESLLTGESRPLSRRSGQRVIGGSLNLGSSVDVDIQRTGGDTLLSGIARMLHRAQAERPPMVLAADRVARWFVGGIIVIAATVFAIWWQIDPSRAFAITLAVLVVTCPCALSLAMPTALTVGTGAMARRGLLVTRAGSLERLARADTILFDKTGTLTRGRIRLAGVEPSPRCDEARALALAGALEAHSEHPLAAAFEEAGEMSRQPRPALSAEAVSTHPGLGLSGRIDGVDYRIGRRDFLVDWVRGPLPAADDDDAGSQVLLADRDGLLASFRVSDDLRPEAAATVQALAGAGLRPELVSGDHAGAVAAVAGRLGLEHWQAGLLPEDKLARVRALQAEGRCVAMVGDGINDAPVLAGADVSVALARGTPLAQHSASIVLLGESLGPLAEGVRLSRRTLTIIRQNMALSVAYNLSALPLAAMGVIPPWLAAIGMSASSLVVVLNALRLGREGREPGQAEPAVASVRAARA
ncbi:MAG: heavy metal translocating P-type ATPase [Gammaproteobacteria bacterium]|nr:heavy metal translocating P-type ATPase [Gammaproteobacteria bacterium]TVQ48079.1 MAG: heavy metal translocating P-type ATPase [Gammaproteobacteria bacterium]